MRGGTFFFPRAQNLCPAFVSADDLCPQLDLAVGLGTCSRGRILLLRFGMINYIAIWFVLLFFPVAPGIDLV